MHTRSPSLLELVRNPPKQGYRFRAELSHYDADPSGRVGIFVGYNHKINAQGNVVHCFVALTFNDCAPFDEVDAKQRRNPVQILIQVPRNPVRLEVMHWIFNDRGEVVFQSRQVGKELLFVPTRKTKPNDVPYRRVEVEVTRAGISAWWEGDMLMTSQTRADILKQLQQPGVLGHGRPWAVQTDYLTTDALGLVVDSSSVRVRNVVIEALAP